MGKLLFNIIYNKLRTYKIMKSFLIIAAIVLSICMKAKSQTFNNTYNKQEKSINNNAVWSPSMKEMDLLVNECGGIAPSKLGTCLISVMRKSGASPQAISFAQLLNGNGYLRNFYDAGTVDAATVYFPFKSNDKLGLYLVNGNPRLINVDNEKILPLNELENNVVFFQMKKKFPHVTLLPGVRSGAGAFVSEKWKKTGQRFLINYKLKNGCLNCELLGFVTVAFDFDSTGNFLGSKIIKIIKLYSNNANHTNNGENIHVYSDPSKTIRINQGVEFAIILKTNPGTGYKWELAHPLNLKIIKLMGTNVVKPYYSYLPGSPAKVVFRLKAVGSGRSTVELKYVRAWESTTPGETVSFKVVVY